MSNSKDTSNEDLNKIITIPNILSFFRLCLIPIFLWRYCVKQDYLGTILLLLLSGFTDILDGYIARRFHMISNLGKALDPVADKLTQIAMLICLVTKFPLLCIPLVLLVVKEILAAVTGLVIIKKTGIVHGAKWHGKMTTFTVYGMIVLHLVWPKIPQLLSQIFIIASIIIMSGSCILYARENYQILKDITDK